MFTKFFLYFNVLLFFGLGLEIILSQKRSAFKAYFNVCAVNSAVAMIVSMFLFTAKPFLETVCKFSDHHVFIAALIFSFTLNEFFFNVLKHSDFYIYDSLNLFSAIVPFMIYKTSGSNLSAMLDSFGASAGFLFVSSMFYFIKKRIEAEAETHDEFKIFCYELILFGFTSASFSIFFRVV